MISVKVVNVTDIHPEGAEGLGGHSRARRSGALETEGETEFEHIKGLQIIFSGDHLLKSDGVQHLLALGKSEGAARHGNRSFLFFRLPGSGSTRNLEAIYEAEAKREISPSDQVKLTLLPIERVNLYRLEQQLLDLMRKKDIAGLRPSSLREIVGLEDVRNFFLNLPPS